MNFIEFVKNCIYWYNSSWLIDIIAIRQLVDENANFKQYFKTYKKNIR